MSEFENALEDEFNNEAQMAYKWAEKHLKQKTPSICYEYGVKAGFQKGARWAREFTVREICEWIIGDGEFIVRNHCPANLKLAIESHFKDRGGE